MSPSHPDRHGEALSGPLLIDAHVHLHPRHDPGRLLDAAVRNVRRAAARHRLADPLPALVIVEMRGQDGFARLREGILAAAGWEVQPTAEPASLIARSRASGDRVLLFAGRQMATAERMEVLSLLSDLPVPDGLELGETVRRVQQAGGLPVIPWGFGKWSLKRGELLTDLLADPPRPLFLGDSGGRPALARVGDLFELAAGKGIWNLPGTDPLPLGWEEDRAGSFGLILPDGLPADRPAAALHHLLSTLTAQPALFGTSRSLPGFVRSQVGLRLPGGRAAMPAPSRSSTA